MQISQAPLFESSYLYSYLRYFIEPILQVIYPELHYCCIYESHVYPSHLYSLFLLSYSRRAKLLEQKIYTKIWFYL
jgi:hypothetical protein